MVKLLSRLSGQKQPSGINNSALRQSVRIDHRHTDSFGEEQIRERSERLRELGVLSLFLHSAGTLEEMMTLFLERSPRATGAVVTLPLLLDRRRELLTAETLLTIEDMGIEQASMAVEANFAELELSLPLRSWRREVLENGEVSVTDDLFAVFGDELSREQCDKLRQRLGITKAALVPFVMEGEAFGLCIFLYAGSEPDSELLELVSGHCTLALKDLLAVEETTRFGGIDPVTWAHSRGYFLTALDGEVVRARRYNRDLSIIFFDIDEFSQFNTDYGHSMGDRLLRAVAMTLAGSIALPEIVARYGGDEFVLLLPESHRAAAVQLTASIVDKLQHISPFGGDTQEPLQVSVSAAIISYPEEGSGREELLAAAETSLEQARQERRQANAAPRRLTAVQQLRLEGRRKEG